MTDTEELQAILSKPGEAVGKYFDTPEGITYVFADERDLPVVVLSTCALPLHAATRDESGAWLENYLAADTEVFSRVRKADPNRNLNLKVGDKVELVNGDVVTLKSRSEDVILDNDGRMWDIRHGLAWVKEDTNIYTPEHIYRVLERAEKDAPKKGLLDSRRFTRVEDGVEVNAGNIERLMALHDGLREDFDAAVERFDAVLQDLVAKVQP